MIGALLITIALLTPIPAGVNWRECGTGKRVVCVHDGDTIWHNGEKIRLMGIDAPEKGRLAKCAREQHLADQATLRLVELLNSGIITVESHGKDKYRRTLAVVRVDGQDVAAILIHEGLATAYKGGKRDPFRWCRQ